MILSKKKEIRSEIHGDGDVVRFKEPIEFMVEHADDCYISDSGEKLGCWLVSMENPLLGYVYGDGEIEDEAWEAIAEDFVFLYENYAKEEDAKLSIGARKMKEWLLKNVEIQKVEEIREILSKDVKEGL